MPPAKLDFGFKLPADELRMLAFPRGSVNAAHVVRAGEVGSEAQPAAEGKRLVVDLQMFGRHVAAEGLAPRIRLE